MFLQPGMQPCLAGAADPVLGAVFGQQQQRGFGTAVVEDTFQRGEVFEQLGLQAVNYRTRSAPAVPPERLHSCPIMVR